MISPSGWTEPGQTPEFDEITVVLAGELTAEFKDGEIRVGAGQALHFRAGEWVKYTTIRDNATPDTQTVLGWVGGWIEDYNENHPHSGLKLRWPREFIAAQIATAKVSGRNGGQFTRLTVIAQSSSRRPRRPRARTIGAFDFSDRDQGVLSQ